ncbi:MAG: hypothetical protein ACXVHK_30365 [Solirubrobacteraceae bacterium]
MVSLVLVAFVGRMYVRSIPTAGNELVFAAVLATVGLTLGVVSGFATHVRAGSDGVGRVAPFSGPDSGRCRQGLTPTPKQRIGTWFGAGEGSAELEA